ncbi:MAG: hypothetical protein HQL02_13095 [Nitrospirae bacterium]|nr:hypothetical protein [Nitrospirota bacterium]
MRSDGVIYEGEVKGCYLAIRQDNTSNASFYKDVLHIRSEAFTKSLGVKITPDEAMTIYDAYSYLFCLYVNEEPAVSLTVTFARDGKLDCEEFYPTELIDRYRNVTGSAGKLCAVNKYECEINRFAHILTYQVWNYVYNRGIRLDIMNAKEGLMSKYYLRMGYMLVENSLFIHPKWQTHSHVFLLPADSTINSHFKDIFKKGQDDLSINEISKYVRLTNKIR